MSGESLNGLAQVLGNLAVELQSKRDWESTLQTIVEGAVAVVPGARWAGISLIHGRSVEARVPSDPLVAELDTLQSDLDDGPCMDALRTHRTVLIDDMASESRWPRFTQAAVQRGVKSLLSFQLFVHGKTLGALNVYAGVSGAFSDDSIFIGELLAQHASVAMAGSAAQTQFDSAVASRDVIGQAKGILMCREKLTGVETFALMVKTSQNTNIKIVDIARWLVEDHEAGLPRPKISAHQSDVSFATSEMMPNGHRRQPREQLAPRLALKIVRSTSRCPWLRVPPLVDDFREIARPP